MRGVPDVPLELMLRLAHAALIARGAESWTSAVGGQRVHRYAFNGRGGGPAVLLLHGLGGSASSMAGLVSALSPLAPRIVLLELPGHGRSPDPAGGPLSAREHGAVAIACAEELAREQGGKVFIAGNSLGGALSLFAAHERPELFAGVAGLNPAGAELSDEAFVDAGRLEVAQPVALETDGLHELLGVVQPAGETVLLAIRPDPDPDLERPAFGLGSGRDVESAYASERSLVALERRKTPKIPCEVQALRIGPLGVAANGAEYFCDHALRIKKASRLKPTFFVSLANDYIGYVPTAQAFVAGGYEPRTARSSKMSIETGQRLVETSLKLLERVAPNRAR